MTMTELYSTEEFERKYTYSGTDLGAVWTREKTAFRLWAPTAKSAKVNLYKTGNPGVEDRIAQIEMKSAVAGTWTAEAAVFLKHTSHYATLWLQTLQGVS